MLTAIICTYDTTRKKHALPYSNRLESINKSCEMTHKKQQRVSAQTVTYGTLTQTYIHIYKLKASIQFQVVDRILTVYEFNCAIAAQQVCFIN